MAWYETATNAKLIKIPQTVPEIVLGVLQTDQEMNIKESYYKLLLDWQGVDKLHGINNENSQCEEPMQVPAVW